MDAVALANLSEAMAYHANAAKLIERYDREQAEQHMKNARSFHAEIARLIADDQRKQDQQEKAA